MVRFRWCALLFITLTGALVMRHAARPETFFNPSAARRLATRATALAREPLAPELATLGPALLHAESISRRQSWLPWWQRDPQAVALAWHEVERSAAVSARALRHERSNEVERWRQVERTATESLERVRAYLTTPGAQRGSRGADVARAAIKLAQARDLAAAGRLGEAIAAAESSLSHAGTVQQRFQEAHARFEDPDQLRFWRSLVDAAFHEARDGRHHVIVDKLERRLEVYAGSRRIGAFEIELGSNGLAQKVHAGDRTTPEGRYRVVDRRGPGQTKYHRALMLDYPNDSDRQRWQQARRAGLVPQGAGPGSLIEIHGEGGRGVDWTDGCVALPNVEMDRLFELVPQGASVTIVGTYERDSIGS